MRSDENCTQCELFSLRMHDFSSLSLFAKIPKTRKQHSEETVSAKMITQNNYARQILNPAPHFRELHRFTEVIATIPG